MSRCSGRGMLRSGSVMPHLGVVAIRSLPGVPSHHGGVPGPGYARWAGGNQPAVSRTSTAMSSLLTAEQVPRMHTLASRYGLAHRQQRVVQPIPGGRKSSAEAVDELLVQVPEAGGQVPVEGAEELGD